MFVVDGGSLVGKLDSRKLKIIEFETLYTLYLIWVRTGALERFWVYLQTALLVTVLPLYSVGVSCLLMK